MTAGTVRGRTTTWDAVHDSRTAFLAALRAQCAPGLPQGPVPAAGVSDDPVLDTAAAILLALLDPGIGLHAAGPAAEAITPHLLLSTGARAASVGEADFLLVDPPTGAAATLALAFRGTPEAPERGATIVYCGRWATPVELSGPGIAAPLATMVGLPDQDLIQLADVNADPPTGVDVLLAGDRTVTALPRSTVIRVGRR